MHFLIRPAAIRDAELTVPGDKSVSHRAVMLGSIAEGVTEVRGFLAGEDCLATIGAFRNMGVEIERPSTTELVIHGAGLHGLRPPDCELDLGNSGTAMRLMAGVLAGQDFSATLTGDESLTGRPMQRIITPLCRMGAGIESRDGKPPLRIRGNPSLAGIDYVLPMASAQVKSAILFAGLYAKGRTTVTEPAVTRDHTERMLRAMGVTVGVNDGRIDVHGPARLRACPVQVPADLSSAAFVILAALLTDNADVLIRDVGVNPTRTGVLDILQAMGGAITLENLRDMGEEPVADIRARSSRLHGIEVDPGLVSLAIDEFPVLFVAAAAADGVTRFSGIGELRVKESDRIAAMAAGLRTLGIRVEESGDGADVHGGTFSAGVVESFGDHRIAMSFAVAGTVAAGPVTVRDVAAVETSFPGFEACLASLGADISHQAGDPA
ncbi:MAG TPA: 3-phosphoshikimate 1-carboxyvinyltransferase [Woeseiaceae bacterium]|nr:3-phosphoshikimate 1-carboxyvinyltransferase [Woeseiaceae bacterium]